MLIEKKCEQCGKEFRRRIYGKRSDPRFCSRRCCLLSERGSEKFSASKRKRPFEALYNHLVYHARRRGKEMRLSYEDFLPFTEVRECHYCGDEISWTKYGLSRNGRKYNLDQKNPDLGYAKENLVVACLRCNTTKSNKFGYDEFLAIGRAIKEYRDQHKSIAA
jgi:hypothetical protein